VSTFNHVVHSSVSSQYLAAMLVTFLTPVLSLSLSFPAIVAILSATMVCIPWTEQLAEQIVKGSSIISVKCIIMTSSL